MNEIDIQSINEKYDEISNSTGYILDNSTYYKYEKLLFYIVIDSKRKNYTLKGIINSF